MLSFWYYFGIVDADMALYLGIDGGGSGCRAAVCDAGGRRARPRRGGLGQYLERSRRRARQHPRRRRRAAAAEAGAADLGGLVAVLGLAGANVPAAVARLQGRLPFRRLRIEPDVVVALKGALGEADGIIAALGTGSVYGCSAAARCG